MKRKPIILIVVIILFLTIYYKFISDYTVRNDNRIDKYIKNLNLELTGIVTDKKDLEHNVFRIFLDIKASNIESYFPKDSLDYYLCVIKDGKAELVVSNPKNFIKGDSVIVSSSKDSCFVFDNKILKAKWKIYVVDYHANGY